MKYLNVAAYGALIVSAGILGLQIGQSAIDDINPIHFQGAAVHPRDRGAAVPEMLEGQTVAFSDQYGWEEGELARSAECGDCRTPKSGDTQSGGEAVFAVLETGWRPDAQQAAYRQEPAAAAEAQEAGEPAAPDQWAQVDRYSNYPLQAEAEPAPAPAEPVPAVQEQLAAVSQE